MKNQPLTLQYGSGATKISRADLARFIPAHSIEKGEIRFAADCVGPWQICRSITGLAITATWKPGPVGETIDTITLHGIRTMSRPRSLGYDMEGTVSLNGRKRSAFTSSKLFELEDGKLVDVAVLFVRRESNSGKFTLELNLDCPNDRAEFLKKYGTTKGRRLANLLGLSGPGSAKLASALSNYAWNEETASKCRLDGNIRTAAMYEAICDRIYWEDIQPVCECW